MLEIATPLPREVVIITKWGRLEDIIDAIIIADSKAAKYVENIADSYRSLTYKDTARKVWEDVKNGIPYVEDPPGKQVIQSPGELYRNRHRSLGGTGKGGDCKSFSIMCGAIFKALGIPYVYRFIAEEKGEELHHVYVVVDDSIICDCVYEYFDKEVPHDVQVDIYPSGEVKMSGITTGTAQTSTATVSDLATVSSMNDLPAASGLVWIPLLGVGAYIVYRIF